MDLYYNRQSPQKDTHIKKVLSDTVHILNTAKKLGITYQRIPYTGLFKLKYKKQTRFFRHRTPPQTSGIARYCCQNKRVTKNLLQQADVSVPKGYMVKQNDSKQYIDSVFSQLTKPLVVKAIDGSEAIHVTTNVDNKKQYLQALEESFSYDRDTLKRAIVEEMFEATEYRILVNTHKVISIIHRIPANVLGNGESTITQLIKEKNNDVKRGNQNEDKPLYKIEVDDEVKQYLEKHQLNLNSIPKKNERVFLLPHSEFNISKGGDTIDVTDTVHPSVNQIALRAIKAVPGLSWTGIDFMSKDILQKQTKDTYRIIELNSCPRILWQEYPHQGKPRNIAQEFLNVVFDQRLLS